MSSPRKRHLSQEEEEGWEPATPTSERRAFQVQGNIPGAGDPEVGRAAWSTKGRHSTGMSEKGEGVRKCH